MKMCLVRRETLIRRIRVSPKEQPGKCNKDFNEHSPTWRGFDSIIHYKLRCSHICMTVCVVLLHSEHLKWVCLWLGSELLSTSVVNNEWILFSGTLLAQCTVNMINTDSASAHCRLKRSVFKQLGCSLQNCEVQLNTLGSSHHVTTWLFGLFLHKPEYGEYWCLVFTPTKNVSFLSKKNI